MRVSLALSEHQLAAIELMLATRDRELSLDELVTHAVKQELRAPTPNRWRGRRPRPRPASRRARGADLDIVVEAGTGAALSLERGDRLRIEQIAGGQCVDLDAFARDAPALGFSAARTRALHGVHPTSGDTLWSCAPETPLLAILADTAPGHDLCFPACSAFEYETLTGRRDHPSCGDIQTATRVRAGLGAYGAPHDPLNLWLPSEVTPDGQLCSWPAACRRGDHIDLVAQLDLVVIVNPCPDDLYGSSQYQPGPVRVMVRSAARAPARRPAVLGISAPVTLGARQRRTVELPDRLRGALEQARTAGWLGEHDGELVRALLFRWWEREAPSRAQG